MPPFDEGTSAEDIWRIISEARPLLGTVVGRGKGSLLWDQGSELQLYRRDEIWENLKNGTWYGIPGKGQSTQR